MRTVDFIFTKYSKKNCYSDYGLVLTGMEIGAPEMETLVVSIPGREGDLDLTEKMFGTIPYKRRSISAEFQTTPVLAKYSRPELYAQLLYDLHGTNAYIHVSDDDTYCYRGRLTVESFTVSGSLWTVSISAECKPYKYYIKTLEESNRI